VVARGAHGVSAVQDEQDQDERRVPRSNGGGQELMAVSAETPAPIHLRKHGARTRLASPHLSIVMPVYNEMATIDEIIPLVLAIPIPVELIVVDDCSTDGTRAHLQEMQ